MNHCFPPVEETNNFILNYYNLLLLLLLSLLWGHILLLEYRFIVSTSVHNENIYNL